MMDSSVNVSDVQGYNFCRSDVRSFDIVPGLSALPYIQRNEDFHQQAFEIFCLHILLPLPHIFVTRSLFKINLYAARGPRNQTGSFYTDCQRNVTTQIHVSL